MEDVVLAVSTCPQCEAKFCICIVSVPPILLIDFRTTEFSPQLQHLPIGILEQFRSTKFLPSTRPTIRQYSRWISRHGSLLNNIWEQNPRPYFANRH